MEMGCLTFTSPSPPPRSFNHHYAADCNHQLPLPTTGRTRTTRRRPLSVRASDWDKSSSPITRQTLYSQWNVSNFTSPSKFPTFEELDATNMLLRHRIVFLGSQVDDTSADFVISQLLLLDKQDPTKDIKLFINSPGGSRLRERNISSAKIDGLGFQRTPDYLDPHELDQTTLYTPCSCPIRECHFTSTPDLLSNHFSTKHWDSGRRFQYNCPFSVSLGMDETTLFLQAEADGVLFLLNKVTKNIGHSVMVMCIPSALEQRFLYYLVAERGISSLRLKSYTQNFPGRVDSYPPSDFLLVPYGYLNSSGELNLEVCIWSSTELDD